MERDAGAVRVDLIRIGNFSRVEPKHVLASRCLWY